jgi:hypothetical protein
MQSRLAMELWELADSQNLRGCDNLSYLQASVGASRARYKLKKNSPDETKLRIKEKVACEVNSGLRQKPHRPDLLKNLEAI